MTLGTLSAAAFLCAFAPQDPERVDVFVGGQEGYASFRIPALLVTPKGALLAFCEGRKKGAGDAGDIDLVLKRSSDGGRTWGPLKIVHEEGGDEKITIGNPCPVVDRATGTIWLPMTRNNLRVFVMKSDDDGVTWAAPVEITRDVMKPEWDWVATGPGVGIQTKSGRLVLPCDNKQTVDGKPVRRSHILYSDDHGKSWKIGGVLDVNTNECQVVEREDGTLLLNMRSYHGRNLRAIATSKDGGLTWSDVTFDPALVEPVCQASLIRFKGGLLFSNPASKKRANMTVRASFDDGATWPIAKVLDPGPSGYSCLAELPDATLACLFERGEKSYRDRIVLARFTMGGLK